MDEESQCEEYLTSLLSSSRFLSIIPKLNGSNLLLRCKTCSMSDIEGNSQAFLEIYPFSITLCSNRIPLTLSDYERVISHELIHAYDYYYERYNLQTCSGLACSEIRAAREGECSKWFIHDYFKEQCIRNHAIRSTAVSSLLFSRCWIFYSYSILLESVST